MRERRTFADHVIVVTGGAGGIGAALGRVFLVASLDEGRAMGIALDICDEAAVRTAMARVCAVWGSIDVLVNNTGISHRSLFADTDASVLHRVMDTR